MITNAILKRNKEGRLKDAIWIMKNVDDYECNPKKEEGMMIEGCNLNNEEGGMIEVSYLKKNKEGWLKDAILIMKKVDDDECYGKKGERRMIEGSYPNNEEGRWLRMLP